VDRLKFVGGDERGGLERESRLGLFGRPRRRRPLAAAPAAARGIFVLRRSFAHRLILNPSDDGGQCDSGPRTLLSAVRRKPHVAPN
jgi:hypothetical protein